MALLELENLSISYGAIQAVRSLNLEVGNGEIVTLIGANGAGKSTTLRAISRLLKVREGRIHFDGRDITAQSPDAVVRSGIAQSPEGARYWLCKAFRTTWNWVPTSGMTERRSGRISPACINFSRDWKNAKSSLRGLSPVENSRCWPSPEH